MATVTATVNVGVNTAGAVAGLTGLQAQMVTTQKSVRAANTAMATSGATAAASHAAQVAAMGNGLQQAGRFSSSVGNVSTQMGTMTRNFDKGTTSLKQYRDQSKRWTKQNTDSAGSSSKVNRLAAERVKTLQTQYMALGKEVDGVQKTMSIRPNKMMKEFGGQAQYAAQRASLFLSLIHI